MLLEEGQTDNRTGCELSEGYAMCREGCLNAAVDRNDMLAKRQNAGHVEIAVLRPLRGCEHCHYCTDTVP